MIIAVVVVVLVARSSSARRSIGRRFVAVGASPAAAHVAGVRVKTLRGRDVRAREPHLRRRRRSSSPATSARPASAPATTTCCRRSPPSCSAARRSPAASAASSPPAVGALFLTQLEQVVLGMGAPASVQLVIQGSIIALGMALRHRAGSRGSRAALRRVRVPPQLRTRPRRSDDPSPLETASPSHRRSTAGDRT